MDTPIWIRRIGQSANTNSTSILSAVAITGVITTAILASKATVKASKKLEEFPHSDTEPPTAKEMVKDCWTLYIPAVISGAATIACIVGANQIGLRRNAALLGAYSLADTAFREYKDEVVKQLGKAKEDKITTQIHEDKIAADPVTKSQVIITAGGDQLCYDTLTGRYFKSDIETIRQAANEINRRMVGGDMYASHDEFYSLVGLAACTMGNELGWNLENFIELIFSSHLADDGRPCLAMGYSRLPRADYTKF